MAKIYDTFKNKIVMELAEQIHKENELKKSTCEVCKKNEAIGVFCVPSVPVSCAYCEECLKANAHPWWVLVSNTTCCGGLDKTADWWKWMVTNTCDYLGRSLEEFLTCVALNINDMEQYMSEEFEKERQKYEGK